MSWYCECCERETEEDMYEVGGQYEYVCLSCYTGMIDNAYDTMKGD